MTESHEFGVGVSQSSSEELMPRINEAADKSSRLAARWEKGCKKYEAALKSKVKISKTARKARRSGNTVEEALADLLRVKREINQFVLANKNSTEGPGEPFFVGMINFAEE
jgi:phage-related minor tail protein